MQSENKSKPRRSSFGKVSEAIFVCAADIIPGISWPRTGTVIRFVRAAERPVHEVRNRLKVECRVFVSKFDCQSQNPLRLNQPFLQRQIVRGLAFHQTGSPAGGLFLSIGLVVNLSVSTASGRLTLFLSAR